MPDRVLTGTITGADHQRYIDVPFALPPGTVRLVVAFDHDGRAAKTVIDLGIRDQQGSRGASGSNKASFSLSASDATPSYLPGRLQPGAWALALAVPNIRPTETARWTAKLWFLKAGEAEPITATPGKRGPGWYRGDLHLHSGQSDGSCASQEGVRVPCPVGETLAAAAARGLDFVALTEHNTVSHFAALREAAPFFDRMVLIAGQEVTTSAGHYTVLGSEEPVDPRTPFNAVADRVHALGGLVAIAHPALPSGEICMGCGWSVAGADPARADAIEVVNGGAAAAQGGAEGPVSGLDFWLAARAVGAVTAIGGSDNHDALATGDAPGRIGRPTTVVYAERLDRTAILAGVRAGRVFIDMDGRSDSLLDLVLEAGPARVAMGGRLRRPDGAAVVAVTMVRAALGSRLELLAGDRVVASQAVTDGGVQRLPLVLPAGPVLVRAVVRATDGRLVLIGNAVAVAE